MRLIVTIPERWEDAANPVVWALVRPDGSLAREGEGLIADLPSAKRTMIVVAASRVLLAVATLPSRGARRIRSALAYAVEDQLTSDPESVHAVAAGPLRRNRQAVAVIEREWLRRLIGSFESAGVSPESVTVETCLPPIADGEWTLVLRGDGGFLRTGEAAGMSVDRVFDGSAPAVLKLTLDAARASEGAPRKIVIRADRAADVGAWERELGVPCEGGNSWREWQSAGRPSVEFRQGEFAHSSHGLSRLWPRLRPAAILAAAALGVEVVGTFCQWGALRYEKAQLEARMRQQFKAAFPQAQAIVDPALQMRRNVQAARAAAGVPQESDFLPLLAKAVRSNPGAGWRVRTISYDAGKLTLDVIVADRGQADAMLKRVADKDVAVTLEAASPKGAGDEARFVFVARGGK
jgi:general secretion pathway protein L